MSDPEQRAKTTDNLIALSRAYEAAKFAAAAKRAWKARWERKGYVAEFPQEFTEEFIAGACWACDYFGIRP